jgi:APA family basic amino acid/polyamine antiporter
MTTALGAPTLRRSLRTLDGLAMVVGIMVGSGILRTPGVVAARLGRPWLTFVAWALGAFVGLLGALIFAELATRHPSAGGKYVFAREAFGRRAAFVIGWTEALGIYCAAIAAIAVVSGEYLARLAGWPAERAAPLAALLVAGLTALHLVGVEAGRFSQDLATGAKVIALAGVAVVGLLFGSGAGWSGRLPDAPAGLASLGALAVAFQSVIWSYYGYPDVAKIAEEVKDPERNLPRILLVGLLGTAALYLVLNAAFLSALPFERLAASTLVPGDAVTAVLGARAGGVVNALALVVLLAGLNGNLFVTPRVLFGLSRDGLAPAALASVNRGGTPAPAMLVVGVVSLLLAVTGTFERLLSLAIVLVLATDGFMVPVLFRLRSRRAEAPFRVPLYPAVPLAFLLVYALLLAGALWQQPVPTAMALAVLAAVGLVARATVRRESGTAQGEVTA